MKYICLIALFFISAALPLSAQEEKQYKLILSGGGGLTKNISVFAAIPQGLDRLGFSGTVRVMWKPEYLLSVGIESGITHVYTVEQNGLQTPYGTTDAKGTLNAIPILFTLSMPLWDDFDIYVGGGFYSVYSNLESFGTTSSSSVLSFGNAMALSYSRPVSEGIRLGAEFKWLYMDKYQDNNLSLHIMMYYDFLKY